MEVEKVKGVHKDSSDDYVLSALTFYHQSNDMCYFSVILAWNLGLHRKE